MSPERMEAAQRVDLLLTTRVRAEAGQGLAGQEGRAGRGARQGRAGQGVARGRAGQSRAEQGRAGWRTKWGAGVALGRAQLLKADRAWPLCASVRADWWTCCALR